MSARSIAVAAIVALSMIGSLPGSVSAAAKEAHAVPAPAILDAPNYHAEIFIGSDLGFTVAANGVANPGAAGTSFDPYIIENWTINATTVTGIHIQNTDAHFVIRNVTVNGTGAGNNGIDLNDVRNGSVRNATIYDVAYGIRVDAGARMSGNILLADSTILRTSQAAVRLGSETIGGSVENVTISGNLVRDPKNGIMSITAFCPDARAAARIGVRTANVTVSDNRVWGSSAYGIGFRSQCGDEVRDITIADNRVGDTGAAGIWVESADFSSIDRNFVNRTGGTGIYFDGATAPSMWNNIRWNTVNDTSSLGIYVGGGPTSVAGFFEVSNNTVWNTNSNCIYLLGGSTTSFNNSFLDNIVHDCNGVGLYIHNAKGGQVLRNKVYRASFHGIWIESAVSSPDADDHLVAWNDVHDNFLSGIYVGGGGGEIWNADVKNNSVRDNLDAGIYLRNVHDGSINGNTVLRNLNGVYLTRGSLNLVGWNTVMNNSANGIYLSDSDGPVTGNTVTGNRVSGSGMFPPGGEPRGHWRMDELLWTGAPDEVVDSSGKGNHGTASGGVSTSPLGAVGRAGDFDGVDDFVEVPHDPSLSPLAFSVEAWVNPRPMTADAHRILEKGGVGSGTGYGLEYNNLGDNRVRFVLWDGGPMVLDSDNPVPPLSWTHVKGVWDGSRATMYINGALQSASATGSMARGPERLTIGRTADFGTPCGTGTGICAFDGLIDEVKITAMPLPSTSGIYLHGSGGNDFTYNTLTDNGRYGIKLNRTTDDYVGFNSAAGHYHGVHVESSYFIHVADNNASGNTVGFHVLATTFQPTDRVNLVNNVARMNMGPGAMYERSPSASLTACTVEGNSFTDNGGEGLMLDGPSDFLVRLNDLTRNAGHGLWIGGPPDTIDLFTGLMGHWKMEEAAWTGAPLEVMDSSGNGNHGTAVAGPNTVPGGVFGRAGDFDGADDRVIVANSAAVSPTAEITVAGWFQADSLGSITGSFVSKRDSYIIHPNTDGSVQFYVNTGGWTAAGSAPGSITLGAWQHWAGTYDGSVVRLYRNGSLVASSGAAGALSTSGDLFLGSDFGCGCGPRFLDGRMDEIRLYARALSSSEVWMLSRTGPAPVPGTPTSNEVRNNTVNENDMAGIRSEGEEAGLVTGNDVRRNYLGVVLNGTMNSTVAANNFVDSSSYGAVSSGGASGNLISGNNFIGNNGARSYGVQARDDAGPNRWNDTYAAGGGNHWSDWTAPDDCSDPAQSTCGGSPDGFVDIPYVLDGAPAARDHYPLAASPTVPEIGPGAAILLAIALAIGLGAWGGGRLSARRR
jgi:parallel beta-helix repeat protein